MFVYGWDKPHETLLWTCFPSYFQLQYLGLKPEPALQEINENPPQNRKNLIWNFTHEEIPKDIVVGCRINLIMLLDWTLCWYMCYLSWHFQSYGHSNHSGSICPISLHWAKPLVFALENLYAPFLLEIQSFIQSCPPEKSPQALSLSSFLSLRHSTSTNKTELLFTTLLIMVL